MDNWILPRDPGAEREALVVTRAIWGDKAHVAYNVHSNVVEAQARSPLNYGSRLEVSVRGDSTAQAARRLLCLLLAYRSEP